MQGPQFSSSVPEVLEAQGESAPAAGPYPKVHQKFIKNRVRKKFRISTENGLPQGPSKSQKSHKICKMGASNAFRELLCPLSVQKRFSSRLQTPPEPQKYLFYCSKSSLFRNPLYPQNCLFWEPFGTTFAPIASLMAPKVVKRAQNRSNFKTQTGSKMTSKMFTV